MNRELINFNDDDDDDDEHFKALKACQDKYIKGNGIHKDSLSFPTVSTVVVQCENGGLWTYGVVEEVNGTDCHGQPYIIRVMKLAG